MSSILKKFAMLLLGAAVLVAGFTWDGQLGSITEASLVSPAQARVGRPLTPVSYAGVARRTTVYRGAAVGAAAVGAAAVVATRPVVVAPAPVVVVAPATQTCVDTVYPDGSTTRTCH